MATATLQIELNQHLRRWTRWARLRTAVLWATHGLLTGLALGLGLSVVARLQPVWDGQQTSLYAVATLLAGGLIGTLLAFVWPRSRLHSARAFDRALGLSERTSTALELSERDSRVPEYFIQRQLDDTLQTVRSVHVQRRLPLYIARNEALIGMILLGLLIASLMLPNDQLEALAEQRAFQTAIDEQVAALEEIRADVENDPALTDLQSDELREPLDEAINQLQVEQLTREEAVSVLVDTQESLRELSSPAELNDQAQGLQQVGAEFGESDLTGAAGESLQNENYFAAADSLRDTNLSNMSTSEQQELADQLEAAADDLADTSSEMASDFRDAAEALRAGDTAAAEEALEGVADQLDQLAAQQAQAEAAQSAAEQVQQSQEQLASAGENQSSQQSGEGQQESDGGQPAEGAQSGQPSQSGEVGAQGSSEAAVDSGQGASGSGTGESNSAAEGGQAGTQPIDGNAISDGGDREFESIFASERLGGSGGPDVQIEGGDGEAGDEIVAENPTTPEEGGAAAIPYNEVFPQYSEEAHRAVESDQVPVGLRAVVRQYFENLEPGN